MPKITSISSRPPRSYDPPSLEDSELNYDALYIGTSPVWNGQETQKFYDTTQDAVFLNAAMERVWGGSQLRLPGVDHFQAHGRTIYNANNQRQGYIPFHSKIHSLPYKRALKVTTATKRASLEPRSQLHPYHPQRRTHSTKNDEPFCSSTGDKQRDQGPQTLFLAVTETNEVQFIPDRWISPAIEPEDTASTSDSSYASWPQTPFLPITETNEVQFIPDRYISPAMEPEDTGSTSDSSDTSNRSDESFNEASSRSPTPSLSRSESVNSSPMSDATFNWHEGLAGPAREGIIPLNFGAADRKRPYSKYIEVNEPLVHPFDPFIDAEDRSIF